MPDASPVKWHLAHTAWFFETFLLAPHVPGYRPFHPQFRYLFNSYYQGVGPRWPRPQRGLLSRPTVVEVFGYRAYVDKHVVRLLREAGTETLGQIATTVLLGLHHEQQHQELILTDLKHAWAANPLHPVYREALLEDGTPAPPQLAGLSRGAGLDRARRKRLRVRQRVAAPPDLAARLSAGKPAGDQRRVPGLRQRRRVRPARVVVVRWLGRPAGPGMGGPALLGGAGRGVVHDHAGGPATSPSGRAGLSRQLLRGRRFCALGRRPAAHRGGVGNGRLRRATGWALPGGRPPSPRGFSAADDSGPLYQLYGDVWQWTASPYVGYPGYRPPTGALGEYNGKFMCNQFVLRGASCATPRSHARRTYRNFFPPDARWQFSGIRLAKELA